MSLDLTLRPSENAIAEVWAVSLAHELGKKDLLAVRRHIQHGTTEPSFDSILRVARSMANNQTPNEADGQAVGPDRIAKLSLVIQPIGS
jgi:hypothetical protein